MFKLITIFVPAIILAVGIFLLSKREWPLAILLLIFGIGLGIFIRRMNR